MNSAICRVIRPRRLLIAAPPFQKGELGGPPVQTSCAHTDQRTSQKIGAHAFPIQASAPIATRINARAGQPTGCQFKRGAPVMGVARPAAHRGIIWVQASDERLVGGRSCCACPPGGTIVAWGRVPGACERGVPLAFRRAELGCSLVWLCGASAGTGDGGLVMARPDALYRCLSSMWMRPWG